MTITRAEKRKRHIQEMKDKLERHTGQPASLFVSPCSPEVEEKFLEHVLAFEGVDAVPLFDALTSSGIDLPASEAMDDAALRSKLWDVIRGMALLGHYLHNTDHLSDRELYSHLWTEILREPTSLLPGNPYFACHIDILGGCSNEDLQLYLKYYADEDYRKQWVEDWPGDVIPAHESPPYDRDRLLPESPYPGEIGADSQ